MRELPTGTVTFLFTDIEGSTKLLHELGPERYGGALLEHRRLIREAFARHGGVEVDSQGDAFLVVFSTAPEALAAAGDAQAALAGGLVRVRIGLHTGTPHLAAQGYVGADVHLGARIAAAGHGGQTVLSRATRLLVGQAFPLSDLGEHLVKDFAEPVWIFQLGSDHFPPLRTISNTNLPRPASSFVGREREIREIAALLTDGARLLTLTGPGGTGKTRLSIEAAAALVLEFKAGVFWVALAALRDPALVSETIAQTLGAKGDLAAHIGERKMLVLLDNLEQVVEAAPHLAALVEACPNLRLLTTSRELLRVRGELEYPVLPLAGHEAVDLYCSRSKLAADQTIAELCQRLDNLPLALELAAARASVLTPEQILERLSQRLDLLKGGRDMDPRQQTLRATTEWSYDLLAVEEKTIFAHLAVFRGSSTLDAIEEVTGANLDTLQSLVDKSLLRHTESRFSMLETIREYASERLQASGDADGIASRHARHFLALAEAASPHLRGDPKEWLDLLDRDIDNLRTALDRFEALGETQFALQLAGALVRFWYMRGYIAEGRHRLEEALRTDQRPTAARARALNGAAVLAVNGATVRLQAEAGLALHRQLGDAWGATYSLYLLAIAATEDRDWSRAQPLFEESLDGFRQLGDAHYVLLATDALAWTHQELGDVERARALHEEVLRLARAQSNKLVVALQLGQLARLALHEEKVEEALAMLSEALRLYRDLGMPNGTVEILLGFAEAHRLAGRAELATRLLARSDALQREIGGGPAWWAVEQEKTLAAIRGQLAERALTEAWEQGRALTLDEAVALALNS